MRQGYGFAAVDWEVRPSLRLLLALLAAALLAPASAGADAVTHTFRTGPIDVAGYEVKQNGIDLGIPRPAGAGYITAMEADLVDGKGRAIPIRRLMLHHIVFANLGSSLGEKKDPACDTITNLDSVSRLPALAERFYGAGEERMKLVLPPGYGYRVGAADMWTLTWMVMNHRAKADRAYVRYRVTYETEAALTPVRPVWLDVRNCRADPVYDVPGGGEPGSFHEESATWVAPFSGRIVAGGGHVHGGAEELRLEQPECGDRVIARSLPTWGAPRHPFYNVRPVLHEPGPVNMTGFATPTGIPVAAGQRVRLTSVYDAERPHTRVMGIMLVFMTEEGSVEACTAPPSDLLETPRPPGRTEAPRVTVPLTGLNARGRAVTISRPPGRLQRTTRVRVRDFRFSARNLLVGAGSTVDWSFTGRSLHDVTVASGPRGFSSPHQTRGGRFSQRLDVPGTYRIFCSLHPVAMTQRVVVR